MTSTFRIHPRLVALGIVVVSILVSEYILRLEVDREHQSIESHALSEASSVRANIEAELNSTVYLSTGLSGYLSLGPELDQATVNRLLATVYRHGRHIRNIALAPDNQIAYLYPQEGNEAALGLDFEKMPLQWPELQRAMKTRSTVVIGPLPLVQGGYGIITQTPVFLEDDRYWGAVSMVVDITSLLESVNAEQSSLGIKWALRAKENATDSEPFVYGESWLFGRDSIRQSIALPGGTWEMAVIPASVWAESIPTMIFWRRLASVALSILLAALVNMILWERAKVQYIAVHDLLTGLPNRRLLLERLAQRIALAERYENSFCIVFVDLDRFKPINDEYGHRCGDIVLRTVGSRMAAAIRGSDTVARVGGDEFVVLLPDTPDREGARAVCASLAQEIERPITTPKGDVQVGASMGVGRYPDDGKDPDELLAYADNTMYAEKKRTSEPRPGR